MLYQKQIDDLRRRAVPAGQILFDGQWRSTSDGGWRNVVNPIDATVLTTIAEGTADDVDAAVAAARRTFEVGRWSRRAPAARKKVMHRFGDLVKINAVEMTVLGVWDNGNEIGMAIKAEPGSYAAKLRFYSEAVDKVGGEISLTQDDVLALVHRQPVGVVGVIVPWNFPLMIADWKMAPALAAGNSVVVNPAENASMSLLRLAEPAQKAGLPDGVFNIVTGSGAVVGEAIGLHMYVDILAFTDSGATGRRQLEYAARSNMKRCYLELGGKYPKVVFADAPSLDDAAQVAANGIFRNSGKVCIAGSRLIVERAIHADFVNQVVKIAEALKVSDPLRTDNHVGEVHPQEEPAANRNFIETVQAEQGELRTGGEGILTATRGF